MSQITTHILDTSIGQPAVGVVVSLEERRNGKWDEIGHGTTDSDGRIGDLISQDVAPGPGVYRLIFNTGDYFAVQDKECFYPRVVILFETKDSSHYHVPLLLNPFGYSTYRGS
jgi:hydroxyisourate hydrolase